MDSEKQIAKVILWQNGLVMVFDQAGEQIPGYQGKLEEVEEKIRGVYRDRWLYGHWQEGWLKEELREKDIVRPVVPPFAGQLAIVESIGEDGMYNVRFHSGMKMGYDFDMLERVT